MYVVCAFLECLMFWHVRVDDWLEANEVLVGLPEHAAVQPA